MSRRTGVSGEGGHTREAWLNRRDPVPVAPTAPAPKWFGPVFKHGRRGEMALNWRHPLALPLLGLQLALMPLIAILQGIDYLVRFRAGRAERDAIRRHLANPDA